MPKRTGTPSRGACSCSSMASTRRSTSGRSRSESRRSFTARSDPSSSVRALPDAESRRRAWRTGRSADPGQDVLHGELQAPATRSRTSALGLGRRRMAPMASLRPVSRSRHRVSETLARRAASRRRSPRCSRCSASQRPNSTHCCDSSTPPACRFPAPESSRSTRVNARRVPMRVQAPVVDVPSSLGAEAVSRLQRRVELGPTGIGLVPRREDGRLDAPRRRAISGSSQATPSSSLGL